MLWTPNKIYSVEPFEAEKDLEAAIYTVNISVLRDTQFYSSHPD
jgi:hypothetical protein